MSKQKVVQAWFDDEEGLVLELEDGTEKILHVYAGLEGVSDIYWGDKEKSEAQG
jgi:hypothetical protein